MNHSNCSPNISAAPETGSEPRSKQPSGHARAPEEQAPKQPGSGAPELIAAVPTPFTDSGELDITAARALFRFAAGTVGQLLVAGTTGEFPALDDSERLALIEAALAVAGPGRVIAHVGAADAWHASRLALAAESLGVTRFAAITPYFLPGTPAEVTAYYARIVDAIPGREVYAYLFPERSGITVTPVELGALAADTGLAGAKLSGSAAAALARFAASSPAGFRLYSGNDSELPRVVRDGGAGVVSGVSAALPEPFAELIGAMDVGDARRVRVAQDAVLDAVATLGPSIGRLKYALALRGLTGTASRMTVDPPDARTRETIARLVNAHRTSPERPSPDAGGGPCPQ
jgi:4-hydroxy-tetrahydrodipicolinate synthase